MRFSLFLILGFLLFSCNQDETQINKPTDCSPSDFNDYNQYNIIRNDCFTTVVDDDFNNETGYFDTGLIGNADVFVESGSLKIENETDQSVIRCIECGFSNVDNFQIDVQFTFDNFDSENSSMKIAWGGEPGLVIDKSYRIGMNAFPRYLRFENVGRWLFGNGTTDTNSGSFIAWPGSNKLTIRNVLPETFFFINEIYVGKVDRAVLDNHREIALLVTNSVDLSIERFQYREIAR